MKKNYVKNNANVISDYAWWRDILSVTSLFNWCSNWCSLMTSTKIKQKNFRYLKKTNVI